VSCYKYTIRASTGFREVRKKIIRGQRGRSCTPEIGSIDRDEARVTIAQTLGVVHGLVGNMKIIMEGTECSMLVWIFS
jgi:hypothetical protein